MDALAADGIAVLDPARVSQTRSAAARVERRALQLDTDLLASDSGRERYRQRRKTIEPVFGHTKHNRKFTQFHRRGRTGARLEWRLLMTTHNLAKLYRHQITTGGRQCEAILWLWSSRT